MTQLFARVVLDVPAIVASAWNEGTAPQRIEFKAQQLYIFDKNGDLALEVSAPLM